MSVQAISWVLEYSQSTLGARLVLISIANHCSVEGDNAWPSVATIMRETNLSERQVQYAFRELEAIGELIIARGTGRGHTHKFRLSSFQEWVQNVRPLPKRVQNTSERVQNVQLKGAQTAPEPSLTVNEPSKDKTILLTQMPEWLPSDAWNGFLEMRKSIKHPLVSNYAIGRTIATLEKLMKEGNDPKEVLDQSIINSWRGVFPIRKEKQNGAYQPKSFDAIRNEGTDAALKRILDHSREQSAKAGTSIRQATGRADTIDLHGAPKRLTN